MDRLKRARQMAGLLDFTLLGDNDSEKDVEAHCLKSNTPLGPVAAVCLYPRFVQLAKNLLPHENISLATVINFPTGEEDPSHYMTVAEKAVRDGADELDFVFPYKLWLSGNCKQALDRFEQITVFRKEGVLLKVILETGELNNQKTIFDASKACLDIGVDFLKTSTGKTKTSATTEAVSTLLSAIAEFSPQTGLKPSGGIRTFSDAETYLQLAEKHYGEKLTSRQFRFGASSLLNDLLAEQSDMPKSSAGTKGY